MFPEKRGITDLFRKKVEPKELVRKWQSNLRTEQRKIERQIRDIQREEKIAQKNIKVTAQRGDLANAKVLARELVHTRKVIGRLYTNKAHMISMSVQLTEQLAMAKVAGTLNKSTEVMKVVNDLLKVPELNRAMREMGQEMMRAGVIAELMDDAMESALDTEDLEEETEEEVDKVLMEVAGETMSQLAASSAPKNKVAQPQQVEEAEDEEMDALQARLNAVRN